MKRKLLLISFILLFSSGFLSAQLGGRIYNYRPTGDLGFAMKPTFSAEIGFIKPFEEDKWVRPMAMLTFISLKPRLAEFPVTGSVESSTTTIYPGVSSYQQFMMLQVHGGIDVAVFKKAKFTGFIGTNAILGVALLHFSSKVNHISDDETITGGAMLGVQLRIGAEYEITDQWGVLISANRNYFYLTQPASFFGANDYGAGVVYTF